MPSALLRSAVFFIRDAYQRTSPSGQEMGELVYPTLVYRCLLGIIRFFSVRRTDLNELRWRAGSHCKDTQGTHGDSRGGLWVQLAELAEPLGRKDSSLSTLLRPPWPLYPCCVLPMPPTLCLQLSLAPFQHVSEGSAPQASLVRDSVPGVTW